MEVLKGGSVGQIVRWPTFPFHRTDLVRGCRDSDTESGVVIQTAMRTWSSATSRWKSRALSRWPSSFTLCILVSARLRRWCSLHRRRSTCP